MKMAIPLRIIDALNLANNVFGDVNCNCWKNSQENSRTLPVSSDFFSFAFRFCSFWLLFQFRRKKPNSSLISWNFPTECRDFYFVSVSSNQKSHKFNSEFSDCCTDLHFLQWNVCVCVWTVCKIVRVVTSAAFVFKITNHTTCIWLWRMASCYLKINAVKSIQYTVTFLHHYENFVSVWKYSNFYSSHQLFYIQMAHSIKRRQFSTQCTL